MKWIVYHEDLKYDDFEDSINVCCPDLGIRDRGLGSPEVPHEIRGIKLD